MPPGGGPRHGGSPTCGVLPRFVPTHHRARGARAGRQRRDGAAARAGRRARCRRHGGLHRYYREITRLASAAKDSGAVVVAITDSPVSDLATHADHLLAVPSEGAAPRTSLAPAMVLVEAVLALVTVHDRSRAQRAMRRIDEVYERTNVLTAS
ncbi:MurR/RpiR family transcriptional regulator [Nonomuraea sp. M3C6]|uniref:MurR/RpiR family transcriptional regulator n=1 Tax=Nonomuraea marmarensis TaxID=3351344 RepID=A0ABW7AUE9_9ACTN